MIADLKPYTDYEESGLPWLGQVPGHWAVRKVREVACVINGFPFDSKRFSLSQGHPLIRIRDLNRARTVVRYSGRFVEAARVTAGDLLIGMDGDFNVGTWLGDEPALLNQRMCCVKARRPLMTHDLRYVLPRALQKINDITYATTVKHLASGQVERLTFAAPPEEEQAAIVRFLDWANGRLDRVIQAKRKVIALLNEQKQAIIHCAVTRGLDPSVPLKPSGIPWIANIPEHWEVRRLKSLVTEAVAGPYGSSLTKSMYTQFGYRVYGQQQVIPDDFAVGDYFISKEQFNEMKRYQVFAGDVLVSVMGTVGRVAVVPDDVEPGIINPRLVRYRPDTLMVRPRWLQLVMQDGVARDQLSEASKGTTMDGLNMRMLGKLLLLKPNLAEQDTILGYVLRKSQPLTNAVSRLDREIDLLREYRTRLVADIVTGKFDVREAAALLPEEDGESLTESEADWSDDETELDPIVSEEAP